MLTHKSSAFGLTRFAWPFSHLKMNSKIPKTKTENRGNAVQLHMKTGIA